MYNSKQRGQDRKLKKLLERIDGFIPFEAIDSDFEHFHVPSTPWIECPKTAGRIKTAFCRKWIEKAEEFIAKKPKELAFCKITAVICYPNLWDSQIIIFYNEEYYNTFWDRKGPYQTWTLLENEVESFAKERGISTSLPETCYKEDYDSDTYYLWYYGEQI